MNRYSQIFVWLFMLYFAYGSNLSEVQMSQRCPHSRLTGKAYLSGYRLTFDRYSSGWGGGVADIVKDDSSQVWGLVYEVTEQDLKRLDAYEGHPNSYRRIEVEVIDEAGRSQEAVSYEVVNKASFIPPSSRYLKILKDAAEAHDFPESYKQFLANIKTDSD